MTRSVLTDSFSSEMLPGGQAMKVSSDDGSVEIHVNLKNLAKRLIEGDKKMDFMDKAAAGAAILHLLAITKTS